MRTDISSSQISPPSSPIPVLMVDSLVVTYGPVLAVRDVTVQLMAGEVRAIVGPNGAGKSSLLRAICGLVQIQAGRVELAGQDVTRANTEARARSGLTLVPEGRGIFGSMTVEDNILVASTGKRGARERAAQLYEIFPLLKPLVRRRAGSLSGGEQQLLALARALMMMPKALLLDEPSMGLSPLAVKDVFEALKALGSAGPGILLIEQNARLALRLANYVYVMQQGRIVTEGPATTLASDAIQRAYLGSG